MKHVRHHWNETLAFNIRHAQPRVQKHQKSMPQHSNPENMMERSEKQQADKRTWSALSTTKRARSASCCATCFASTALVNCRGNNSRRSDSAASPFKLS